MIGCLGSPAEIRTDMTLNFVPEMPRQELLQEYRRVVSTLYDPTLEETILPDV